MKTKHYDADMLLTIKKSIEHAYDTYCITGEDYELEVINNVVSEHTGFAHIEKCIEMNMELFNKAGSHVALFFNANWRDENPKLQKKVRISPIEIVDEI